MEQVISPNERKPLLLAGWSFGGILASYILQDRETRESFPKVSGLILYAPMVAPKPCGKSFLCQLSNETLTHDASLWERELKPKSALEHLPFGAKILLQSSFSWKLPFPADLQTLIFASAQGDAYVQTSSVLRWVGAHRSNYVSRMSGFHCELARHELDNELLEFGGEFVRDISRDFAIKIAQGQLWTKDDGVFSTRGACRSF